MEQLQLTSENKSRVVVSVLTSRSRDVSDLPMSPLSLVDTKIINVLVSAIYVSCLRPIFRKIVKAT